MVVVADVRTKNMSEGVTTVFGVSWVIDNTKWGSRRKAKSYKVEIPFGEDPPFWLFQKAAKPSSFKSQMSHSNTFSDSPSQSKKKWREVRQQITGGGFSESTWDLTKWDRKSRAEALQSLWQWWSRPWYAGDGHRWPTSSGFRLDYSSKTASVANSSGEIFSASFFGFLRFFVGFLEDSETTPQSETTFLPRFPGGAWSNSEKRLLSFFPRIWKSLLQCIFSKQDMSLGFIRFSWRMFVWRNETTKKLPAAVKFPRVFWLHFFLGLPAL